MEHPRFINCPFAESANLFLFVLQNWNVQPEMHSLCSIHNDKTVSAELMTLSGGWGGRGQGLGLLACVTGRVEGETVEVRDGQRDYG